MAQSVLRNKLSKSGASDFLRAAQENTIFLSQIWGTRDRSIDASRIVAQIPHTREAVFNRLGLNPCIITQACCSKCFALYPLDDDDNPCPTKCKRPFLSSYQRFCKWAKEQEVTPECNNDVLKLNRKNTLKPSCTFSYVTLQTWLTARLLEPHFETLLDSGRNSQVRTSDQILEDVWDGRVWNEFADTDHGDGIFNQSSGNLVFSLYLDWFNAEGSSALGSHNSVGAITLITSSRIFSFSGLFQAPKSRVWNK